MQVPGEGTNPSVTMHGKSRTLTLLAVGTLLAMTLWFSASAVVPQLTSEWRLSAGQASWLTMSVQLGFVVGAFVSASVNLADRVDARVLFGVAACFAAAANAGIVFVAPISPDGAGAALVPSDGAGGATFGVVLLLRFVTGALLAGVYPTGMKLMASWCGPDRGFGIGLLVGALTVGSATPHLLAAVPIFGDEAGVPPWRGTLLVASLLAASGAGLVLAFVRSGPLVGRGARFSWRFAGAAFANPALRLANMGYLGHMWELYAMWTWVPLFLLVSFADAGLPEGRARLAGFAVIAVGGLGSVAAGLVADRLGRTRVTAALLALSGACALVAGFLGAHPWLLTIVCLVWGFAVVADSGQFSAAVSELADPHSIGTALTMQTCLGFLLTLVTIRMIPPLVDWAGWGVAFATLALGPAVGAWSMLRLRRRPEAVRMASGNR